jgi:hypothetical protein
MMRDDSSTASIIVPDSLVVVRVCVFGVRSLLIARSLR